MRNNLRIGYDRAKEGSKFCEEQFLLCPPRVLGYAMRAKSWSQLLVTKIKSVGHDKEDAFKTLVLADTQKHWSNPW